MKKYLCISAFGLLFFTLRISGQEIEVKGKVHAFETIPLHNVEVISKNSGETVKTNERGFFEIKCNKKDNLTFKAHGFSPVKVSISPKVIKDSLDINMKFKGGKKNIEVATGYGHIDKNRLSYAVTHLSDKNVNTRFYRDILEMIEGRVSGISILTNGIIVRGVNTYGNNYALLVVDGYVVNWDYFKNIDPQEVRTIDVLKGSAAAIYGSRAMDGVIVVTTKKNDKLK